MASIAYVYCEHLSVVSQYKITKWNLKKSEIRVLLKRYWKQDYEVAAAVRRIGLCEMVGEGIVVERVVQRWFQRFNTEKKTLRIYHVLDDLNYGILRVYAWWRSLCTPIILRAMPTVACYW